MNRSNKYPRLSDLAPAAQRKIPPFVFAYLDSGTGHDKAKDANRTLYDAISLTPQFLRGRVDPDISVSLLGKTYKAPFGVSPIGLASLIWPGAEQILAAAAKKNGFPLPSARWLVTDRARVRCWRRYDMVSTLCTARQIAVF